MTPSRRGERKIRAWAVVDVSNKHIFEIRKDVHELLSDARLAAAHYQHREYTEGTWRVVRCTVTVPGARRQGSRQ